MSNGRHIQEKLHRLETLRRYQAYYGPNTPYQIVAEINQLEVELRRMLQADLTRPTQTLNPDIHLPKPAAKKSGGPAGPKKTPKKVPFWRMSQATIDMIATIAFIGLLFLFGSIVFAAYVQSRSDKVEQTLAQAPVQAAPKLRPTFTPTRHPDGSPPEAVAAAASDSTLLPSANRVPTEVPTPVPTFTPTTAPSPTNTPTPTNTPVPTKPPPPPPTATPAPPTSTPAPSFPFTLAEQGNRVFQKTDYHVITIYVAITTHDNVPIGGLKIVGDHSSGMHKESALSDWNWSVSNCLDCDYVKFGNVKFEPGTFSDGVWNIYVADPQGNQLSPVVPLSYSSDPAQWVWDFLIFRKQN